MNHLDAQPALRLAQLQAVYDGSPAGLGFLDSDLRFVNVNRRLADVNGFSVEEHLGRDVDKLMPVLFPLMEPHLRRALDGESVSGVEVSTLADAAGVSKTFLLSYQPARDEAGEVVGVSIAVVDVTDRKGAEEALHESQEHYRHMLEHHPQTAWMMDPEGRNLEVSPPWEWMAEPASESTRDQQWLDALHPDDREETVLAIEASRISGRPINVEYRVAGSGSTWRWMRSRGSPRYDVAGRIVCWYGSVEDIDEQKRLEEKVRKYEQMLGL